MVTEDRMQVRFSVNCPNARYCVSFTREQKAVWQFSMNNFNIYLKNRASLWAKPVKHSSFNFQKGPGSFVR